MAPGTSATGLDDLDADERAIVGRATPYTMASRERLVASMRAADHVARAGVPGDIVECGVWRGGNMMAMALALLRLGDTARTLHLYDTFEGMTEPTDADVGVDGESARRTFSRTGTPDEGWCRAGLDEVRAALESTGYPAERLRFIRGKVEETIPGAIPRAIAVLRLDTDWYESTRHELEHLYPRLSPGGILIVDDYGHWAGARRATDEYLAKAAPGAYLHRIDYTGREMVKT